MSESAEFVAVAKKSIAEMPPWHIWIVSCESIGSSQAEVDAAAQGQISAQRVAEIQFQIATATQYLRDVKPAGIADWMPPRRAAN